MSLTLYASSSWTCPSCFHVFVALEEMGLPYKLEVVPTPLPPERKAELQDRAVLATVPILVHDDLWLSESIAISQYLTETFAPPAYPRILPADAATRGRARQIMSWLRTSLSALREYRPTEGVFGRPTPHPLTDRARADAGELVRVAAQLLPDGKRELFETWCIADTDLALALMRIIATDDPMPQHLIAYARAQFGRASVRRYLAHLPTAP